MDLSLLILGNDGVYFSAYAVLKKKDLQIQVIYIKG